MVLRYELIMNDIACIVESDFKKQFNQLCFALPDYNCIFAFFFVFLMLSEQIYLQEKLPVANA